MKKKDKSKLEEGYAGHNIWLSDEAGVFPNNDVLNHWNSIIESVFKESPETIKGVRGCITVGAVDIMSFYNCGNKECSSCKLHSDALHKEIKHQFGV